jgi:CDP-glucose 4,6-dehydratase
MTRAFWRGRPVFVTGHTGFKGAWLCLWLHQAGAVVHGYAKQPPTEPNLFDVARIRDVLTSHTIGDVLDRSTLEQTMRHAAPEVVFHLAAQSLVRPSYREPVDTFATNVMGTVNLLEAVRACPTVRAVINVTTDKCYQNNEWLWGYRESEPLGGHDPYSSSKACSELVTAAYRSSFFAGTGVAVATARAGNVIGGGDWSPDRLLPDFFRAESAGRPLEVRFPDAVRPWQHVLEPLSGYLELAQRLCESGGASDAEAWNFGPSDEDARPVRWLLDRLVQALPSASWLRAPGEQPHEAGYLKLDSSKARARLGWHPCWDLVTAIEKTAQWHAAWRAGADMTRVCSEQIAEFESGGRSARRDVAL